MVFSCAGLAFAASAIYRRLDVGLGFPREALFVSGVRTHLDRRIPVDFRFSLRASDWQDGVPQPERIPSHARSEHGSLSMSIPFRHGSISATLSDGRCQVPNRTGLGGQFEPVGQGYGFAGLKPQATGLESQQSAGQDIAERAYQRSIEARVQHASNRGGDRLEARLFHTGTDLRSFHIGPNLSRFSALDPSFDPNGDGPLEYLPSVSRNAHGFNLSAEGWKEGRVRMSAGLRRTDTTFSESVALSPGSQLALNALAAQDLKLVGAGQFLFDDFFQTIPTLDVLGNQVYALDPGAQVPVLRSRRTVSETLGWGRAQWARGPLTVTASLGYQSVRDGAEGGGGFVPSLGFDLSGDWGVLSGSARRNYSAGSAVTGSYFGASLPVERRDAYELAFHSPGDARTGSLWVRAFHYDVKNRRFQGMLVPGTQIGLWGSYSLDQVKTTGIDVQIARSLGRLEGSVSYRNALSKARGFDQTGFPVDGQDPLDEGNRLRLSAKYTFGSSSVSAYWTSGSGLPSSDVFGTGDRRPNDRWDLNLETTLGRGRLRLFVVNLFDQRDLLSFNSRYLGTSFQSGRKFVFQYSASF